MPTGTGKSKTSAMITSDRISLKKKLLFLVPSEEIFNQILITDAQRRYQLENKIVSTV